MPIAPFLLSSRYIAETKVDVFRWAEKIVAEQKPSIEKDIYFYTPWAVQNIKIIEMVKDSFQDQDIQNVIKDGTELGVF